MAKAKGGDAAGKKATAKAKAERAPKETVRGFRRSAKITLKKDDDGKVYGAANNPCKGAAADRFAKLRSGMTVDEAIAAGVEPGDIRRAFTRGHIDVAGGRAESAPRAPRQAATSPAAA